MLTSILALLTVLGNFLIAFFVGSVLAKKKGSFFALARPQNFLLAAFLIALSSLVFSLYYSEVLGYAPCTLCWIQRIFMYSQVFILGYAWIRNEVTIAPYSILLSSFGALVALYNHYLQLGGDPLIPCGAGAVSCAQRFVFMFGYVSIPWMSFTAFALMIIFALGMRQKTDKK